MSNINFFMFLLVFKVFMALGAIWDNYGQVPFNKMLTFFFISSIGIIFGNSETKDISDYKLNQWTKL